MKRGDRVAIFATIVSDVVSDEKYVYVEMNDGNVERQFQVRPMDMRLVETAKARPGEED